MKVALCQMHIKWENKKLNEINALNFIEKAVKEEVQLILFPEMSLTGFSMNTCATGDDNNQSITKFREYAKKYNINIGLGWVKILHNGKAENHYTIIGKNDSIINDYIKIHPFSYAEEDRYFISGDKIKNFKIQDIPFSCFICYDLRFPEVFQMASREAHIIIIPANWPQKRCEHWMCLLRARAIENQVYIFGINCVGNQDNLLYSGDSCVINPNGEIIELLINQEGLIIYNLIDDVSQYRNKFPIKQDRRDYYGDLLLI